MITIKIYRNDYGQIYEFEAENHGNEIVCAAVSALVLNAVNSIETFTDVKYICNYNNDGGFIIFSIDSIKKGNSNKDADLLLNSMLLGLNGIMSEYSEHIKIIDEEVL